MTPKPDKEYPKEPLLSLYRSMKTIREFEEKVYFLFLQGIMPAQFINIRDRRQLQLGYVRT